MSRNGDYTTRNLLDYLYHQNYYKHIGTDLSRQTNKSISRQIPQPHRKICFNYDFYSWRTTKPILKFSLDLLTEQNNMKKWE